VSSSGREQSFVYACEPSPGAGSRLRFARSPAWTVEGVTLSPTTFETVGVEAARMADLPVTQGKAA
jgi:hypothetical protein